MNGVNYIMTPKLETVWNILSAKFIVVALNCHSFEHNPRTWAITVITYQWKISFY